MNRARGINSSPTSIRPVALALALAATLFAITFPQPAFAHQGNPDFRSIVNAITPEQRTEGLEAEVVNFDDHVVLTNRTGQDVLILGYDREPYARISADGTVEVNLNSPSHYLNEDRFANVPVPERADKDAEPAWEKVEGSGRFEWHDHRSHYMSEGTPSQVTDESVRTKVFDYTIPIEVGGKPASIDGTLYWQGKDSRVPVLPFILLAVVVLAAGGFLVMRRRRGDDEDDAGRGGDDAADRKDEREAW